MDVTEALLDSWDRQCRIVSVVAGLIDESNCHLKPSEDGWPLDQHLAHMLGTRRYFLKNVAPERAGEWGGKAVGLAQIKAQLAESGVAVREVVTEALKGGVNQAGWYDNPVLFLQHMVWHEGWHVGLIFLALRLGGQEPAEEWEETKVWGEWRTEVWQ
jgi:uncharacterized damage-inducible protein DinB